ncbi:MAG: hypothetical protein PVG39_15740 [Desulfobacteraceae bacterium]
MSHTVQPSKSTLWGSFRSNKVPIFLPFHSGKVCRGEAARIETGYTSKDFRRTVPTGGGENEQ